MADAQIRNGEQVEARQTLAVAEAELQSAKPEDFDQRTRLAGWISLSELYSNAYYDSEHQVHIDNDTHAKAALDQAIAILHSIQPEVQRAYFIRSIARQIREISGEADANKSLVEGAGWASEIQNLRERRRAYRHIAGDLFVYRDIPDARDVLRRDPDPAWRTDTLVGFTRYSEWGFRYAPFLKQLPGSIGAASMTLNQETGNPADTRPADDDFGTPLDYQSNFAPEQQPRQ